VKAVVLARGLGTRMKAVDANAALPADQAAVAATGLKALVPLGGRPFLDFVLSALADAGCSDICLVIGPEHEVISERYLEVTPPRRFRVAFAVQSLPLGTGDAVLAAETFVGKNEFLMVNADNYYPIEVLRRLVRMGRPGTVLFTPEGLVANSNIDPARILAFALGTIGADGCLDDLIEKPAPEDLARIGSERHVSMNCWRFPPSIFEACRGLTPSARGELELTTAIVRTIGSGVRFKVELSADGVLDLSRRADIGAVAARLRDVAVSL